MRRILLVALLLWGCSPSDAYPTEPPSLEVGGFPGGTDVSVVTDPEHGVVCYVYVGYAIDCLEIAR